MKTEFDLERYLKNSKAVDVSDINWDEVRQHPIDPTEIRCLTYMMDIEAYTIMYLRDLLNTRAVNDPDVSAFLACWVYEESYHGRALESFLRAADIEVAHDRVRDIREQRYFGQFMEAAATFLISNLTRHFIAAHMTWGAIQELTTLTGYGRLAQRTKNPILALILRRIVQDESRHFSFYYHQAASRLKERAAQKLTAFLLKRFWTPVGGSIKPREEVDFITSFIFAGSEGLTAVKKIDQTISRLPGLDWFDYMQRAREKGLSYLASLATDQTESGLVVSA